MLPDRAFFDRLADAAKAETLPRFRTGMDIVNKQQGGFDPVTEGDRAAEAAIRALIEAEFPEHGILGEEQGNIGLDREHVWVIDPIDGTRAFISGLPVWGTLIGFQSSGRAVMGMMDQPFTGERYFADGESSWYRGPDGARRVAEVAVLRRGPDGRVVAVPAVTFPLDGSTVEHPEARLLGERLGR